MLCLLNSGATFTQTAPTDDFVPLKQTKGNEVSRSKRDVGAALMIGSLIMGAVSLGVCTAHAVTSSKEASSGCYYIPDACEVQKQIKNKNQEVLKIMRELETLETEVDQLKEEYDASTIHYKTWTETLGFISDVINEVMKIGEKQMNFWGINVDAMETLDKAKASYEEGLKDLLSSSQMTIAVTNSILGGVGLFSTTMYFGFSKLASVKTAFIEKLVGVPLSEELVRITGLARNAFAVLGIAISAASTGMCAYGLIKSKADATKKYNDMVKYRDDIQDALDTLVSAKNEYEKLKKDYEKGIQTLTSNSNEVLDAWANHCPNNYDEKTATEEEKENCAQFKDQMKICVTCQSTLRDDLNLLSTNWKYVERDAEILMNEIRNRKINDKRVIKALGHKLIQMLPANGIYDYSVDLFPEPEFKGVILEAMSTNPTWAQKMGKWSKWQNSGNCFDECKIQHQVRTCQTESCIGHDTRKIPCFGEAKEKCQPKSKVCPMGWTLMYGTCYKIVHIPEEEKSDILFPKTNMLTTAQQQEQTLTQISKLDDTCCKDAFDNGHVSQKDCQKINEYNPQLARIDYQSEHDNIIVQNGEKSQHVNTQLVYLDLMLSTGLEDETIQCKTFLGSSKTSVDQCQRTTSSAVCEINLSDENNVLYRLLPRRCKTKEKQIELDDVCKTEAEYAEIRRNYRLHDAVCTQNLWNHQGNMIQSVSAGTKGVWAISGNGTVNINTIRSGWSLKSVSDCVVKTETSSQCEYALGQSNKVEVGNYLIIAKTFSGKLYQRTQVSNTNPEGQYWMECSFCGSDYKDFSVSKRDHLWAIDSTNNVLHLAFRKMRTLGDKKMMLVSVGAAGVWAVDLQGKIFSRKGTYGDLDRKGSAWDEVNGPIHKNAQITSITSGEDIVFITTSEGRLYYRASVSQRKPQGEAWVLSNHGSHEAGDILIKSFSTHDCEMLAIDHKRRVFSNKKSCDCL